MQVMDIVGTGGDGAQTFNISTTAALYIGGKADSLKSGVVLAASLIDSGEALRKLDEFRAASQA
jgi:anthranilate phosphoribosyltransferase